MITALLVWLALARADAPASTDAEPAVTDPPTTELDTAAEPVDADADQVEEASDGKRERKAPKRWGGVVIPIVTYNSTDGLAVGVGGELFERDLASGSGGFKRKIAFQALVAVDGRYQAHLLRYETRTGKHDLLIEVGFRKWTSLLYAGIGGDDVLVDWGPLERENRAWTPFVNAGVTHPLGDGMLWFQGFFRYMQVDPGEASLLAQQSPPGAQGGAYTDLAIGYLIHDLDRWPMPDRGWRAELDVRGGGAWLNDRAGFTPSMTGHGSLTGWLPVFGPRLVVAGRVVAAHAVGDRPFFENEFAGGRRRFEIGYEKSLMGYGRNRSRGDGVLASLVEVRPHLFRTNHPFFDLSMYLSLFAEEAWLFEKGRPGPHMPTLGVGAILLWQDATILRPFVAWGWRADDPDGLRRPMAQFGLSLEDAL